MSRRREAQSSFDPTISRGILAILLLIAALIVALSFIGRAGTVGTALNDYVLSTVFGNMRFVVPLILAVSAWFLVKDIDYNYRATHALGATIFILTACSLLHIHFAPGAMWSEALLGHGGGIMGMPAWALLTYFGALASYIILLGLGIVSLLLMFNTAIVHLILMNKKMIGGLGALGRGIISATKALFVIPSPTEQDNTDTDDEEGQMADDNTEEDEPEEERSSRQFATRTIAASHTDTDEEETEDEAEDEADSSTHDMPTITPGETGPWAQKVIVRELPPFSILSDKRGKPTSGDIKANALMIQNTFQEFGIDVDMGEIRVGPTVTQYSMKPHKGVKLSRITGLSNDLALALAAHPIRIEAPIPGKSLVGIEVPNQKTALVSLRELLEGKEYKERPHNMMIALGKDVAGKIWFADLPKMPHLLIAGTTGSGKTVCVNTILLSLLYQNTAETLRMIMVDPKRVELTLYNGIPHLLTPVITNVNKTINALKWTIGEMERRFEVLAAAKVRDIGSYNLKNPDTKIPYIVFVIDELADLMATAAGEVEAGIIRLAQMARAVGIHLIVATQRPSVDVITGLMKANIPARIAFSVASVIDSRTILDCPGADKLLGRGDMLFLTSDLGKPVRIQGAFISEDELKDVAEYLKGDEEPTYDESIVEKPNMNGTTNMFGGPADSQDPLFADAKRAIIDAGKASASFMQRKFKIGYARAARILDELEAAGVIGPSDGAKPREILVTSSDGYDTMDAGGELNVFDDEKDGEDGEKETSQENDSEKTI